MAALVSEYTLEFFTLLNARGKKELIEWCMKEGLIASSYECPKYNEQMGLNERKSVVLDGFEWRCRKSLRERWSVARGWTWLMPGGFGFQGPAMFLDGFHTLAASGIPKGKSPVESDQENVEANLRRHHIQVFGS
ncbi:uncharacterized protein TNCV_2162041 [Trichonephila clavipes]|nr:uncharacterized protein TNCV_2162041 [Trichonephila clavipes]